MENYGVLFWLGILGGNVCYVIMLLALGMASKKSSVRKVGCILLVAGLVGFILLNPFFKEIKLPGIVSGTYGVMNNNIRFITGVICNIIPFIFIPCYQFFTLKMKLLRLKMHPHKSKYVGYVYHDAFYLLSTGLWCMYMFSSLLFGGALSHNYKVSWNWFFGVLLAVYYIGGICMVVLQQSTFTIMDGRYSYHDFKKKSEGELKDIESVEMIKGGMILHIKGEELHIRCTQKPYADVLADKLAGIK